MVTYTNNGGLIKPATGEFSGTWGDKANTNFDIIDTLVNGYTTITLSTSPYALATSDGIVSLGQYMVINFIGTPATAITVNITPTDATKIYFMRNSCGQTITISQGSGSTVSIPTGTSKVVYTDGLGGSASVYDFTSVLSMSGPQITGGTITGITDLALADGGTGASTAATARTNLGVAIGTNVLAYDANLQSFVTTFTLPTVDSTAGYYMKTDGAGNLSFAAVSGALGGTVTSVSGAGGTTGLTLTGGPITGSGTLTLGGTLAVANGGSGAITALAARTNLGVAIGTDVLAYDSNLQSFVTAFTLPTVDSTAGYYLKTDGAGTLGFSAAGTVTSVSGSGGTTGLTLSGGPITGSGTLTLGGTLAVANGGTNIASYTIGDLVYASTSTVLSKLADVATGNALISGGVGAAPSYGKIGLTTHISGTLPIANGGTGAITAPLALTALGAQAAITGGATTITTADLTASRALSSDASGKVAVATTTLAELNFVNGVTSAIQTQIDAKAPSASPTLTSLTTSGTITIGGGTSNWTVIASTTNLTFAYGGVNKMRLDSSGNITVVGNVTAYGTIT